MRSNVASVHIVASLSRDEVLKLLRAPAGAELVEYAVDGSTVTDRISFFSACYRAFFGGDIYGHNLDAFEDVCGDVIYGDPVAGRRFDWGRVNHFTLVLFRGCDVFLSQDIQFWRQLGDALDQRSREIQAEHGVRLVWVFEAGDDTLPLLRSAIQEGV